jgi:hypothetical protein
LLGERLAEDGEEQSRADEIGQTQTAPAMSTRRRWVANNDRRGAPGAARAAQLG